MQLYRSFARRVAGAMVAALCLGAAVSTPTAHAAVRAAAVRLDADRYLSDYKLVTLDPSAMLRRARANKRVRITAGLEQFDLDLKPHDLRAPDYRAQETLEDGTTRTLPSEPVRTFAGRVTNREGATARFTMEEGRVSGLIIDGEDRIFVEPLATFSLAGGPTDYVVYHASDVRPEAEPGTCGATEAHKLSAAVEDVADKAGAASALTSTLSVVQIATEADNEYVSALGSASAANNDILTILNQVDGVYEAEVGLTFQVVLQHTYAGADPYSTTTDPNAVLTEFLNYWNANMAGVQRDITHMWTGRDMTGSTIGIAYVGVVCSAPSYSYGVSQRYTSTPQRYVLTAHEIGHNFNACHSDSSCNPSPTTCSNTIMQSVVGTGLTFCAFSHDQIASWVSSHSSCLSAGGGTATPPAAPSGLAASAASATQVNLSWSDNSSDETGFKVERKTGSAGIYAQIGTAGAGATGYSDATAVASTLYYYRVRATNSAGDSTYSNEANATTLATATPAAPSNLAASAVSSSQINLQWSDNSGNETGFKIERSTNGSSFSQIATVGANVATYASTGLKRNRTYYYRVRAYNASGNSGYSNTASGRSKR